MHFDAAGLKRPPSGDAGDRPPSCSPDGRQIVFASERDETREIYIMNSDGTDQ